MSFIITSDSHPIGVDFLSPEQISLPGRLGLTLAPGVKYQHSFALWDRDAEKDLHRLRVEYRIDLLVSLIEEAEFELLKILRLRQQAKEYGINLIWFPIRDASVPTSMESFATLVGTIIAALKESRTVIVHCMAGLGRTGLVAASCLVALGINPPNAVALVREARPGTLEVASQVEYLEAFRGFCELHELSDDRPSDRAAPFEELLTGSTPLEYRSK